MKLIKMKWDHQDRKFLKLFYIDYVQDTDAEMGANLINIQYLN